MRRAIRRARSSRAGKAASLAWSSATANRLPPRKTPPRRERLQATLAEPDGFLRHHRRDSTSRDNALELVRLMPTAMIYSYAPGQPQPKGAQSRQIVIDFHPDPNFHPPTMLADLLTGLAGRFWIDSETQRVTRAEASVLHPVNFGWGVVGTHLSRWNDRLRAGRCGRRSLGLLAPRSASDRARADGEDGCGERGDERLGLPCAAEPVSFQDAIRMLLAEKIPLR